MKQLHAFFIGKVHDVGFRYTAKEYALQFGITGWVKNLADGRVELLAEGEEDQLQDLLRRLEEQFDAYIEDKQVEWLEPTGQFPEFHVEY